MHGAIKAEGTIKTLVLDGSLVGTGAANTGLIYAADDIKSLSISGDLKGGSGALSGSVAAGDGISKISIAGDLLGGAGAKSGSVASFEAKIGKVDHDGEATAGTGTDSGKFLRLYQQANQGREGAWRGECQRGLALGQRGGYAVYAVYLQEIQDMSPPSGSAAMPPASSPPYTAAIRTLPSA